MNRTEQKQEAGRFLEFRGLDELAEYIGFYFPEEIHVFASVEKWYTKDDQGEKHLDRDALNDFLRRYGAGIRYRTGEDYLQCETIED
jgi:hypothetical protein